MNTHAPPRTSSSTTTLADNFVDRANKAERSNHSSPLHTGSGGGRVGIAISGEHGEATGMAKACN